MSAGRAAHVGQTQDGFACLPESLDGRAGAGVAIAVGCVGLQVSNVQTLAVPTAQ